MSGESLQSMASGWPMPPLAPSTATFTPRAAPLSDDADFGTAAARRRAERAEEDSIENMQK